MAHILDKKWRSQDVKLRENVDFSALLLSDRVTKGLKKAGFRKPSPIQLEAIPMGRFGKDMMVQAKSGTGKTLVFAVIALELFKHKLFRPQVLVIVPTREIATQVCSVIKTIGSSFHKLTCNTFIGGLPLFEDQEKAVMTQIVVGTPGRLRQLINLKSLPTNSIRLLIFDEADELLHSNSFKEDIEDIFTALPDEKQVIATSATYSPKVKKIMYRYLCDPQLIRLNAKHVALLGMVHYAEIIQFCPMPVILYKDKLTVLEKILKTVKFAQCLLFCNGIQRVEVLYKDVRKLGFSAAYISSAKEQSDRMKAMERLKRFKCKVLVSSDLTSRGIDAENVDLVVNFDLSYTSEVYMHRVGRAGRYGSIGVAISLVDDKEIRHLQRIEKEGSFKTFKLPDPIPTDLILNPSESEFIIDDPELEDDPEAKSNIIKRYSLNGNDYDNDYVLNGNNYHKYDTNYDSEKEENAKNIEVESVSETSAYITNDVTENILSELAADDMKSHDSIKHALECEMKDEKGDEDGIADLNSKNIKTVHHTKHSADKKYQNEYVSDDGIVSDTNKNADLFNGFDQNELIINEPADKPSVCDIYDKSNDCCDKNILEKQDITKDNIKNDIYGVPEKNEFETDDRKLNEANFNNLPQSSEQKDIEKISNNESVDNLLKSSEPETVKDAKNDLNRAKESSVQSCDELSSMIKVFLDTHANKSKLESMKSKITVDGDSQQMEDSGRKLITTDMINNLQFQKHEFFCETFKKFQEKKDSGSGVSKIEKEVERKSNEHNLDLVNAEVNATHAKLAEKSEFESKDIFTEKFALESTPLVKEEITTVHTKLAEASEFRAKKDFPEKPTFESTPQANDKIKQGTSKEPVDDAGKPNLQGKLSQLFQVYSDDTDSDDSTSTEEVSEVPKQSSAVDTKSHSSVSDSESVSSSNDSSSVSSYSDSDVSDSEADSSSLSGSESSSDSSSSTAASYLNDEEESVYRHNCSRTGRQNPSLISGSVRGQLVNDQNYYDEYYQDHNSFCCRGTVRERIPRQRRKPCLRVPSNSACCRNVENIPHHCNSSLFDHRGNSHSSGICPSRNRRLQSFANRNVTQSYSAREHSMCHRSRHPLSSVTRGRGCPTHQRSSRHHHTLSCFMPTEHRCHPNTPDYPCEQGQLCEIWYKTFYNQWLHIQSSVH